MEESYVTGFISGSLILVQRDSLCDQGLLPKMKQGRMQGAFINLGRLQKQSGLFHIENNLL